MNDKVANILKQVQELPAEERNALIEALAEAEEDCEFASPEIARAWEEEIERRIAAYDRGETEAIDAYKVTFRRLAQ